MRGTAEGYKENKQFNALSLLAMYLGGLSFAKNKIKYQKGTQKKIGRCLQHQREKKIFFFLPRMDL